MKTDYPVECSKLSKVTHFNYSCRTVSRGVVLVTIIKVKLLSRSLMKLKKIRSQHLLLFIEFHFVTISNTSVSYRAHSIVSGIYSRSNLGFRGIT